MSDPNKRTVGNAPKPYKTLIRRGAAEAVEIKRSRFFGEGSPVRAEEEARRFLAEARARHPDAGHCAYAYLLGENGEAARFSDDGEPGGTAGLPIAEALKRFGLTNLCVAVCRYFGGTLLGAGGLARAYAAAACEAVKACGIGEMLPARRYLMEADYPQQGRLDHYFGDSPATVLGKRYAERVEYEFSVLAEDAERLERELTELSDGTLEPVFIEAFAAMRA